MRRIIFSILLAFVLMPKLAVAVLIEADLDILSFTVLSAPDEFRVGEEFEITLQKSITNSGGDPSGIVDFDLTYNATAPLGSSVSPTMANILVEVLAVGEIRTVQEVFTLILWEPGLQTFTFANSIPVSGNNVNDGNNWIDPDPSNNGATLNVGIVGVVPEPTTLALLSLGLAGLGFTRRRMKT